MGGQTCARIARADFFELLGSDFFGQTCARAHIASA